jgi:hypothetical protein
MKLKALHLVLEAQCKNYASSIMRAPAAALRRL